MPEKRPYLILLAAWLGIALIGSIIGAVPRGAASILPSFARYGLGLGAVLAVLLAAVYLIDRRLYRGRDASPPRDH